MPASTRSLIRCPCDEKRGSVLGDRYEILQSDGSELSGKVQYENLGPGIWNASNILVQYSIAVSVDNCHLYDTRIT